MSPVATDDILVGMQKSRISVILPTLASQRHILVAVRSTLFALGPKDELLVLIEGTSSFESGIESISDPRLKIFHRSHPEGIVSALNFLIEKASGELIARMDGDDICLPFRFHFQRKNLERKKVDFIFSNAILFGSGLGFPGIFPQIPFSLNNAQIGLELAIRNPLVHPTMLAKRSAVLSLGGYSPAVAEDYVFWIKAWEAGFRLARTAAYGILYRVHPDQLTQGASHIERAECDPILIAAKKGLVTKLLEQGLLKGDIGTNRQFEDALKEVSVVHRVVGLEFFQRILSAIKSRIKPR